MNNSYLPSTSPGKSWQFGIHKPQGRPAYAVAIEGEEKIENGYTSFTTVWPGSRSQRVAIAGPATAKRKAAALAELELLLKGAGVLA